jgi:hypothetical protein
MELIGKKVSRIVNLNVEIECKVYGEILKETKFKTGNKAVQLKVEGEITDYAFGNKESSVEIYLKKWTEKGINCKQWFNINEFEKIFKIED